MRENRRKTRRLLALAVEMTEGHSHLRVITMPETPNRGNATECPCGDPNCTRPYRRTVYVRQNATQGHSTLS